MALGYNFAPMPSAALFALTAGRIDCADIALIAIVCDRMNRRTKTVEITLDQLVERMNWPKTKSALYKRVVKLTELGFWTYSSCPGRVQHKYVITLRDELLASEFSPSAAPRTDREASVTAGPGNAAVEPVPIPTTAQTGPSHLTSSARDDLQSVSVQVQSAPDSDSPANAAEASADLASSFQAAQIAQRRPGIEQGLFSRDRTNKRSESSVRNGDRSLAELMARAQEAAETRSKSLVDAPPVRVERWPVERTLEAGLTPLVGDIGYLDWLDARAEHITPQERRKRAHLHRQLQRLLPPYEPVGEEAFISELVESLDARERPSQQAEATDAQITTATDPSTREVQLTLDLGSDSGHYRQERTRVPGQPAFGTTRQRRGSS